MLRVRLASRVTLIVLSAIVAIVASVGVSSSGGAASSSVVGATWHKSVLPVVATTGGSTSTSPLPTPTPTPTPSPALTFGVTPDGWSWPPPAESAVMARLAELAGGRPFVVHLYIAWDSYEPAWLDREVQRFGDAVYQIALSVRYKPPADHEGDVDGFAAFVRDVVGRHAANAAMRSFVIGNEANLVYGDPNASDGPFAGSHEAVVRGVIAARDETRRSGSAALIGFNFAQNTLGSNINFMRGLAAIGGEPFLESVQYVAMNAYPGAYGGGSGDFYADMIAELEIGRASIDSVAAFRQVPMEMLEIGQPSLDQERQAAAVRGFVRAARDGRDRFRLTHFNWFDLWDVDSQSTSQFAHYGLLRSDLALKPAFTAYQEMLALP